MFPWSRAQMGVALNGEEGDEKPFKRSLEH